MFRGGEGERGDAVSFCFSFNKAMYEGEENLQRVGVYLETMRRPAGMPDGNWPAHLAAVSWADRIMVRKSTGMTPYRVVFGQECLLPVEIAMESWRM